MLEVLRRGDTLVVKSPERLVHNTVDLLNIAHEPADKDADLELPGALTLNVDRATGEFLQKSRNMEYQMSLTKEERERKREQQAASVVNGAKSISGFRIMDPESEDVLSAALGQYDGNERNHVSLSKCSLNKSLQQNILLHCKKLELYGAFNGCYLLAVTPLR
jgi:hypothetical protein